MIFPGKCYDRKCKHWIGVQQPDGTEASERIVCMAYPNGIPRDIWEGLDLHLAVRSDQQNSIVFEKREG